MTLVLLKACMLEKNTSIIQRSNVQSDVIVVNQYGHNSVEGLGFENQKGRKCYAKFICTTERGLSRSRNMALRNAWGDIFLFCNDDELMEADYEVTIIGQYLNHMDSIVNTLSLIRKDCARTYSASPKKQDRLRLA